ncbi:MAG: hypothetical protein LBE37_17295 [Sphingobacterium sp.]|jgi:FKBP-type peptidyl-prolyl cis-trans isomerase|nr:hypothetical protein [Sphingobacterium sp.]
MKNLFKTVLFAAVGVTMFASCNSKNDFDIEAERARILEQEKIIDAQLSKEKSEVEKYVTEHFDGAGISDTTKVRYSEYQTIRTRGIWYEILKEPTDNKYEYKIDQSGQQLYIVYPKVKINYTVKLLDGTVVESGQEENFNLAQNFPIRTQIWNFSFAPAKIKHNSNEYATDGLTKLGLKQGSKIRVVTPSLWAYGTRVKDKIPVNSPLVYEFEVLTIE